MNISEIKVGMTLKSSKNAGMGYKVIAVGRKSIEVSPVDSPQLEFTGQDPEIFTLLEDAPVIPGRKEMKIRIREALTAEKFRRVPCVCTTRDAQRYTEVWGNGEDEITLCWKVEYKPTKKSK